MAADVVPGLLAQRVGDLMKISKRLASLRTAASVSR
jgi:hypothetical protein